MHQSVIVRVIWEGTTYDLDIQKDIPLRLDVSAIENTEIGEFFGVGSQTFDIAGTKENNRFFGHAYNVGAEDIPGFSNTIDGMIVVNGDVVLKGQFQLLEVIKDEEGFVVYKCQITDGTVQFKDAIQNKLIKNADWSAYEHTLNTGSILDSWQNNLLDGKVFYPLADYGYNDPKSQGNYPLFAFSETGTGNYINNPFTPIQPSQFLPAVRAKDVLEVVCAQAGFSASGDFIESGYFSNLYILPKAKEEIGVVITGSEQATGYAINDYNQSIPIGSVNQELALNSVVVDPLGKFFTSGSEGYGYYLADGNGEYEVSAQIGFFNPVAFSFGEVKIKITLMRGGFPFSGTVISSEERVFSSLDGFNTFYLNTGGSFTSTTSEEVWVWVDYTVESGSPTNSLGLFGFSSKLQVDRAPEVYNNATVDMALQWPEDLKSIDIITGIIQQFNLVVYPSPDQDKTIVFEQFDEWIRRGELKDWTDKWDTATRVSINHTIDEQPQELILGNEEDSDRFSVEAKESDPYYQYGTLRILADNNISQGSRSVKNTFGPTVLGGPFISGSVKQDGTPTYNIDLGSSFAYPHLYKFENNQIKSYKFRPRIGFKSNNTFPTGSIYNIAIGTSGTDRTIISGSYGTLSNVNGLPAVDGAADLHFNNSYFKFAGPGLNLGNTTSNFDTYWKTYIDSLYWDGNRKVTLDVLFSPEEYKDINLNDIIFIKDQRYRINKISGYNLVDDDVVTVELIRLYPAYSGQINCDMNWSLEETDASFNFIAERGGAVPTPTPTPTVSPTPGPSPTPTPTPTSPPADFSSSLVFDYDVDWGSYTGTTLIDATYNGNSASIDEHWVLDSGSEIGNVLRSTLPGGIFESSSQWFNDPNFTYVNTDGTTALISWYANGYVSGSSNQRLRLLTDRSPSLANFLGIDTVTNQIITYQPPAGPDPGGYTYLSPTGSVQTNCWNILQYAAYYSAPNVVVRWSLNNVYSGSVTLDPTTDPSVPSFANGMVFGDDSNVFSRLASGSLIDKTQLYSSSLFLNEMEENYNNLIVRYQNRCNYPTPTPTATAGPGTPTPTPTTSPTPTPTAQPQVQTIDGYYNIGTYGICNEQRFPGPVYIFSEENYVQLGDVLYEDSALTTPLYGWTNFLESDTNIMWLMYGSGDDAGTVYDSTTGCPTPTPTPTQTPTPTATSTVYTHELRERATIDEYFCGGTYISTRYSIGGSTLSEGDQLWRDSNLEYRAGTNYYYEYSTGKYWYKLDAETGVTEISNPCPTPTATPTQTPTPTPSLTPTPTVDLRTYNGSAAWSSFYDACNSGTSVTVYTDGPIADGKTVYSNSSLTTVFSFYQYLVITGSEADGKGFQFPDPNTTGVVQDVNNDPCNIGTFSLGVDFNEYEACTGCVTTTKYSDSSTFQVGMDLYTDVELNYDWTEGIGVEFAWSGSLYEYDGAARFGGNGVVSLGTTCYTVSSFNASDSTATTAPTWFCGSTPEKTLYVKDTPGVGKEVFTDSCLTDTVFTGNNWIYNHDTDELYNYSGGVIASVTSSYCPPTPTPSSTPVPTPTPTPGPTPTPTPTEAPWKSYSVEPCFGSGTFYYRYQGTLPSNFFYDGQCYRVLAETTYFDTDPIIPEDFYSSCTDCDTFN